MSVGPDTRFILSTVSKCQTAVSHSTPEADLVALYHVVRTMLIPGERLVEHISQCIVGVEAMGIMNVP